MPWMAALLAALALLCLVNGNRFVEYDELQPALVFTRNMPKRCSRFRDCTDQAESGATGVDADLTQGTSKMLNALFGLPPSTPASIPHTTEATLTPHQLPPMYYNDFYDDLLTTHTKRNDVHAAGCDCKVMNNLTDLGSTYFPRYLMTAVCEPRQALDPKCSQGSNCKPLEYKMKVLVLRPATEKTVTSASSSRLWFFEDVSQLWQWEFETVTVTAGCFCTS